MCSISTNQNVGQNDEPRKTIAVVDDDISVRASLARILKSAGFHVETYAAAQVFLDAGAADVVDLLILDYHMPGKNGLELQRELLADHKTIPIVMISGDANENVRY